MPGTSDSRVRMMLVFATLVGGGLIGACTSEKQLSVDPGVCWHLDGSRWECPDSVSSVRLFKSGQEIASASLVVTTVAGTKATIAIPRGTDAIFLAPDGLEILVQHYRVTDPAKAEAVSRYLEWARKQP